MITDFIKALLAGGMISIGGSVFLSLSGENRIAGALLFAVGLMMICVFKLNLFTGKAGYLARCKTGEGGKYLVFLAVVYIGNLLGTLISALLINMTRLTISETAASLSQTKLSDSYISLFVLAIFCGMLMFLAVESYAKIQDGAGKYLAIMLCVSVFILAGFEHCIADMFYFALCSRLLTARGLISCLLMGCGNMLGSLVISLPYFKLFSKE